MVKIDGKKYKGRLLEKFVSKDDEVLIVYLILSKEWEKKGWYPFRLVISNARGKKTGLPTLEAGFCLPLAELLKQAHYAIQNRYDAEWRKTQES